MEKVQLHKPPFGPLIVFVLLAILVSIAYKDAINAPWHFDDKTNILNNAWIQISNLSWSELKGAMYGQLSGVLRQTSYLGFALNYYFAGKIFGNALDPITWHIVNIILHILTSYLIFLLSFDILKRTRENWEESTRFWIAVCAAILFAVNPIQTQTVTYIVQRLAGAAAFWYLLTLLLYIKHRTSERKNIPYLGNFPLLVWITFIWYAVFYIWRNTFNLPSEPVYGIICLAIVLAVAIPVLLILSKKNMFGRRDGDVFLILAIISGLIALTTKENTITLPFFCWLYDYLFISGHKESFKRKSITGWMFVAGFFVLVSPVLWVKILDTYEDRDFTVWERILTQFRVVWSYLITMLYPNPSRLNLDIDITYSRNPLSPISTFFAIIAWFAAVIGSIKYLKKDKLIPFLILWYFGHLLVESSAIGLEMVYEHRFYLPGFGPFLLIAYGIFSIIRMITHDMQVAKPSTAMSLIAGMLFLAIVGVNISWDIQRNLVWADEQTLWRDVVSKSPGKIRPKVNLGFILEQEAESLINNPGMIETQREADMIQAHVLALLTEAEELYRNALKTNDTKVSELKKRGQLDKASQKEKDSVYALVNLGHLYLVQNDYPRALEIFRKAELLDPEDPILQFNLGVTLKSMGQLDKARTHYEKAIEVRNNYYEAMNNLGILEVESGNIDKAVEVFTEATQVSRFPELAYYNLGNSYIKNNDLKNAQEAYIKALQFRPTYLQAMVNLANVYSMQEDYKTSVGIFLNVLKLDPDHINTHYNLGLIYMEHLNQREEALFHFKRVLQINPNISQARNVEALIRKLQGESDKTGDTQ